jgi:hypothetical protein
MEKKAPSHQADGAASAAQSQRSPGRHSDHRGEVVSLLLASGLVLSGRGELLLSDRGELGMLLSVLLELLEEPLFISCLQAFFICECVEPSFFAAWRSMHSFIICLRLSPLEVDDDGLCEEDCEDGVCMLLLLSCAITPAPMVRRPAAANPRMVLFMTSPEVWNRVPLNPQVPPPGISPEPPVAVRQRRWTAAVVGRRRSMRQMRFELHGR